MSSDMFFVILFYQSICIHLKHFTDLIQLSGSPEDIYLQKEFFKLEAY